MKKGGRNNAEFWRVLGIVLKSTMNQKNDYTNSVAAFNTFHNYFLFRVAKNIKTSEFTYIQIRLFCVIFLAERYVIMHRYRMHNYL